jgi:serine/threonine-protein kinase
MALMSVPTFTGETFDDGDRPVLPPSSTAGVGRVTVLPRVEEPGGPDGPRLVSEERQRFALVGELGQGGLGVVVAAEDLDIGRKVAIKKIRPDRRTEHAFLRFVQEVRTVGRLDHPNIVPIHDVGRDDDGSYWFVMKYVDGETLESVIERLRAGDPAAHRRFTFERRAELFLQILHAVRFAHDRGVVHRDLKPANVMVGQHGEVQLLDWGVARQVGQAEVPAEPGAGGAPATSVTTTRAGQVIGTPRYMSPEQAAGEPVDARADTWALSMLFYELLTLHHPFEGIETVEEVLEAVRTAPIPHPADTSHPRQEPVPADLAWYVADGLDRAKRYPSVDAMLDRLERRNDGEIPVQCPVSFQLSMLARARKWIERHPRASIGVAAGVAFLAAAGLVLGVGSAVLLATGAVVFL